MTARAKVVVTRGVLGVPPDEEASTGFMASFLRAGLRISGVYSVEAFTSAQNAE